MNATCPGNPAKDVFWGGLDSDAEDEDPSFPFPEFPGERAPRPGIPINSSNSYNNIIKYMISKREMNSDLETFRDSGFGASVKVLEHLECHVQLIIVMVTINTEMVVLMALTNTCHEDEKKSGDKD